MYSSKKEAFKKRAATAFVVAGSAVLASPVMALTTDQNTEVSSALTSGGVSVSLVVGGLITLAAILTGFGIVYRLLAK